MHAQNACYKFSRENFGRPLTQDSDYVVTASMHVQMSSFLLLLSSSLSSFSTIDFKSKFVVVFYNKPAFYGDISVILKKDWKLLVRINGYLLWSSFKWLKHFSVIQRGDEFFAPVYSAASIQMRDPGSRHDTQDTVLPSAKQWTDTRCAIFDPFVLYSRQLRLESATYHTWVKHFPHCYLKLCRLGNCRVIKCLQ